MELGGESILQNQTAYAIMPLGTKRQQVHEDKERNPRTVRYHSPGILLFFETGDDK